MSAAAGMTAWTFDRTQTLKQLQLTTTSVTARLRAIVVFPTPSFGPEKAMMRPPGCLEDELVLWGTGRLLETWIGGCETGVLVA